MSAAVWEHVRPCTQQAKRLTASGRILPFWPNWYGSWRDRVVGFIIQSG